MNYEFNFSHHQSADSNEDWTHTAAVEQWKDISLLRKRDEGVGVKLKAQISNVPEVSRAVPPDEWLHHIDAVFSAGAAAVRPVEKWLAEPNAVNNALLSIGPQLDTAADYYSNAAPEQIVTSADASATRKHCWFGDAAIVWRKHHRNCAATEDG